MAEAKKGNFFTRLFDKSRRWVREMRSELKKVVWPSFPTVVRNTLIVAGCVLCVGVFIWVADWVGALLLSLLSSLI